MEANLKMAKLDLTGLEKNPEYLRSVLNSYIKNHKLPIKIFSAQGEMYLMRLDIDNDGKLIENWQAQEVATEGAAGLMRHTPAVPITSEEVAKRFNAEKNQVTK